jgi:hypothetical protein
MEVEGVLSTKHRILQGAGLDLWNSIWSKVLLPRLVVLAPEQISRKYLN